MSKEQHPKKRTNIVFELGGEPISIELDVSEIKAGQSETLSPREIQDLLGISKFLSPYEYTQVLNGIKATPDYDTKMVLTVLLASRPDLPEQAAPIFYDVLKEYYNEMDSKQQDRKRGEILYLEKTLKENDKISSALLEALATPPWHAKPIEVSKYYRVMDFLPNIKGQMPVHVGQLLAKAPIVQIKLDLLKRDDLDHHVLMHLAESMNPKIMAAWIANPIVRSDKTIIMMAIDRWAHYRMKAAELIPKNIDLVIMNLDKLSISDAHRIANYIIEKNMPYSILQKSKLLSYAD